MKLLKQRTLRNPAGCSGIGLHSGAPVRLTLLPAPADRGVYFVRTDLPDKPSIPARTAQVVDTSLATTLGVGAARVSTVEHLLSALYGLGIDNCRVEVSGPEIPILDGSAAPFVDLLIQAGIREQDEAKCFRVVRKPIRVQDGHKRAALLPSRALQIDCTIDFDHPLISKQSCSLRFEPSTFIKEVARARTFGFRKDVDALQKMGLARGGTLENAVVVDEFSILNPEGLRYPNEFARHKLLDALGDLALAGMPLLGHLQLERSGHALHHKLLTALDSDPSSTVVIRARTPDVERFDLRLGDLEAALAAIAA